MKIAGTATHPKKRISGIEIPNSMNLGWLSAKLKFLNFMFNNGNVDTINHEIKMMMPYRNHLFMTTD